MDNQVAPSKFGPLSGQESFEHMSSPDIESESDHLPALLAKNIDKRAPYDYSK